MMSDTDEYFLEELASLDQQIENYVKEITLFLSNFNLEKGASESAQKKHIEKIQNFLKEVHILLCNHQGVEEFLIPHIGEFRSQNGLQLLPHMCQECQFCENAPISIENYDTLSLWEQLISHLEKFIIRTLECENQLNYVNDVSANLVTMKPYMQLLQGVYIPEISWNIYSKYRSSKLKQHCTGCDTNCFSCFLNYCVHCVCEDQLLIYSGHFYPLPISWTKLLSPYFILIEERLKSIIIELKQWCKYKGQVPLVLKLLLLCKDNTLKYAEICAVCCLAKDIYSENCAALQCFACLSKPSTNKDFNFLYAGIVSQIIKLMHRFELQIDVLSGGELPTTDLLHTHEFDLEIVAKGTDFTLPSDSPEASPVHENLGPSKVSEENFDTFSKNWRLIIASNELVTQMQRLLQINIQDIIQMCIEEEKSLLLLDKLHLMYGRRATYALCSAALELNTVLQSVLTCVKELERFLPLLYASEGPFFTFRSSFCHAVNTYVIDLLKHIENVSRGPPKNFVIYYLYVAISSAVFLRDKLNFYNNFFFSNADSESEFLLKEICKKSDDLVTGLIEEAFLQNLKYTSCGILFDADSYDFQSTKPFYEGERVSYSVQMFNFNMKASLSDMQFYLPQQVAQEIYARVLCESLLQLAHRYAHCSPTEARTPQIQSDIVALLLCVSELIYPACHIAAQFTEKDPNEKLEDKTSTMVARIHSICCTMLSTMALLASPLPELYKVFGKCFPVPPLSVRSRYNSIIPWLPWMQSHLFPDVGQSPMMSTVKVWLAVKACTSWLQLNPEAIVKAYTEHYCTLSILIMSQTSYYGDTSDELASESDEQKTKLATSIFHLLSCYESVSNCLSNIFLPILERTNSWIEFDVSHIDEFYSERPWWFKGLFQILKPYSKSVLLAYLPHIKQWKKIFASVETIEGWKTLSNILMPFITCSCDDNFDYITQDSTLTDRPSISLGCISKLLENMDDFLIAIPSTIKICLATLDTHFLNYVSEAEPIRQSLPIQTLLSIIISYLNDAELLSDLIGCRIEKEEISVCTFIVETLKSVLLGTQSVQISKDHISQIDKRLNHIAKHFKDLKDDKDNFRSKKKIESLEEEVIKLTALSLLKKPDGIETMIHLQKVLCMNEAWIQSSLGIFSMLSSDSVTNVIPPTPLLETDESNAPGTSSSSASSKRMSLQKETPLGIRIDSSEVSGDSRNSSAPYRSQVLGEKQQCCLNLNTKDFHLRYQFDFNPFEHFDQLGECHFKDAVNFTVPWEALLSHLPILGLTEVGFRTMLEQRWDIRGEGPVAADQEIMVQELKKKYELVS